MLTKRYAESEQHCSKYSPGLSLRAKLYELETWMRIALKYLSNYNMYFGEKTLEVFICAMQVMSPS